MANLGTNDKQILERLFQMSGGYVLNFTDRTFAEFFRDDLGVDIFDPKYNYASGSKANRMRGFWRVADDALVSRSIQKLLSYINTQILLDHLDKKEFPEELLSRSKQIADALGGKSSPESPAESEFITREFGELPFEKLGLEPQLIDILKARTDEIRKGLQSGSPLSVVFLCGSTLEGILLGAALKRPREFNTCSASPKDRNGKPKAFRDWTLSDFINAARELKLVGEDVKKFSHALRDFRNFIHPYEQLSSGFNPDKHTAKISWQVLQAAIAQIAENRP